MANLTVFGILDAGKASIQPLPTVGGPEPVRS
jgi:hypothetical protein